jgi:hypothetical protein
MLGLLAVPFTLLTVDLDRPHVASESERLRRHFSIVEHELLAADVSTLTAEQRIARATHIRRLREYAGL